MNGIGDHTNTQFGYDGWDPPEDFSKFTGDREGGGGSGGGGGSEGGSKAPYRFKLPVPEDNPIEKGKPARKRVMIIGAPFYLWEHSTFKIPGAPKGVFNAICPKQNRISEHCPLCEDKKWPSYGAYFTIIDLGFVKYTAAGVQLFPEVWKDRDGKLRESQFQRRLMVAKKGGKDKPGMQSYFEDQRARRGDLTGCVFDTMRQGKKESQIGETWEFVERASGVTPATVEDMKAYLSKQGAPDEYLAKEWLLKRFTIQDLEPHCLFPAAEMARWLGVVGEAKGEGGGATGQGNGARTRGAGYDGAGAEGGGGTGDLFKGDKDFRGGDW